jgi:hypothetical protein
MGPQGAPGAVLYLDGGVVIASDAIAFAGFTTVTSNGNLGGSPGANRMCQNQFPGSYFCTLADYGLANTSVVPPTAAGAWVDFSRATTGQRDRTSCETSSGAWTTATSGQGGAFLTATGGYYTTNTCDNIKPLACCRGGPRPVIFRGFTTATFTGSVGGQAGATQQCQSQYPGSFFCTAADFDMSNTGAAPGGSGAWVDYPRAANGERDRTSCETSSGAWTTANSGQSGADLTPVGGYYAVANCQTALPLACCANQ